MKKIILLLTTFLSVAVMQAQNNQPTPQVNVTGTSEIKIVPNYAVITIGVETKNDKAEVAKNENDAVVAKMLKTIKKFKIEDKHFQTQRVNLFKNRDYEKKRDFYQANQTVKIELYNLDKYDELVGALIADGANSIQGVEYKSTETEKYQAELRKKAALNAKAKAEDFASAFGQKVGKALVISDNSSTNFNPPMYAKMNLEMADASGSTLAVGEITLNANVSISFELL
ncbi:SIMPL domain-containing protein [Flavobacterium agricola]|uniref:SIMPL domain-containing protein n=1 Tax=Flavobacterium agricola TaxID=2870839 RepID=A0ABY6LW00_9FLAO|nr:SIMPL domain-containing protein [Flavobacterium agricola]UYW00359.1 SIMPL domain-containing protein [Flavobacterium agricola]